MTREQFLVLKDNIESFHFSSLVYTEYEDIADYEIMLNNHVAVIIYGFNVEGKKYEYHWACNNVQDLLNALERRNDNELITFVPKEWVKELESNGFNMYAVWKDYSAFDLEKYANSAESNILKADKHGEASEVTLSCIGQSRGFTGQSKDWMKQWINGQKPAVPDYTFDSAVLAEIEDEMLGIICIGIYGEEEKKTLWVRELAVRPKAWRKGIGRKLLGQAFSYGIKHGAVRAFLLADECNGNAMDLYRSMGFTTSGDEGQIDMIRLG